MWRLVFDGGMDYDTVFYRLTPDRIRIANTALDLLKGNKG